MTQSSAPIHALKVSRADLAQALKIAAKVIGKFPGHVGLHFDDGFLTIETGNTVGHCARSGSLAGPDIR